MKFLKKEYIPNYLSIFRIFLVPFFVYLFMLGDYTYMLWAGGVFIFAGITDVVDGFLARKFNWVTNIGKLLDPLADKLMQIAAIICLYFRDLIPRWLIIAIIGKELLMIAGATLILKREKMYVNSNWYGKLGTTVFYAVVILIIWIDNRNAAMSNLLSILLLALTIFTFVMYYIKTYRGQYVKIRKEHKAEERGNDNNNIQNLKG